MLFRGAAADKVRVVLRTNNNNHYVLLVVEVSSCPLMTSLKNESLFSLPSPFRVALHSTVDLSLGASTSFTLFNKSPDQSADIRDESLLF